MNKIFYCFLLLTHVTVKVLLFFFSFIPQSNLHTLKEKKKSKKPKRKDVPLKKINYEEVVEKRAKQEVLKIEPSRGKTNNVVSEQVRHKPACTSTEES